MDLPANLITWTFVMVSAPRTVAYLPQIVSAVGCRIGARAVSLFTCCYFLLAHVTGGVYSQQIVQDAKLAGVFFGNAVARAVLVAVIGWKRWISLRRAARASRPHE